MDTAGNLRGFVELVDAAFGIAFVSMPSVSVRGRAAESGRGVRSGRDMRAAWISAG
jgi:hypothetical protein